MFFLKCLQHLLRVVVIIAQKLLPPSRIGDFQKKVNETFQSACKKNKEALSPRQLKSLVEKIKKNLKEFECTFTADDANEIHRALDGDGDGVITAVEFSSWILRGAALSYQERNDFSSKSALHKRMCNFLEAVCVISGGAELLHGLMINVKKTTVDSLTIEQLTDGLQILFNQFDTDHSGTIDQNELQAMMIDLPLRFYVDPDTIPTADDVEIVMTALDADGSGEVDFEEWKDWVMGNRSMNAKQRQKFASQSKSHFRLNGFVETLLRITKEMTVPLGNEEELNDGLIAIFNQSATTDGHIGPDEIFSMVSVLSSKHPDVSWFDCDMEMSQTIADALDADGNGTIEVDEWVRWMIRGANRPAIERAKFAAHNETFMLLTKFLEGISIVAKKLTAIIKKEAHLQSQ
jgi:Ca2+-binding EF-hand superfamily protein